MGECDAAEFGNSPTIDLQTGECRCLICSRCAHHTGNGSQGHYWAWCKETHSVRDFHFCCPDEEFGCELRE